MSVNFAVADMTIHRIVEQETPFFPVFDVFPDLSPELYAENARHFVPFAFDENDVLKICVQSYVVRTPHHVVMIDSCVGNDKERLGRPHWHRRTSDAYMRNLAAAGLAVEDIDYVLCTHLHVDHVGWNTRLDNGRWVPTFPNARYLFDRRDYDYFNAENAKAPIAPFVDSVLPVIAARRADLVDAEHAIGDHVRLLPTPGHTPGHVAVRLGRERDEAVVTGDLVHSPLQMRYPELSPRFDVDKAAAAVTRRAFFERYCDTPTLCCTAHFPSPSVGRIKRWGDGFKCEFVEAE